jgi:hypothetical protein
MVRIGALANKGPWREGGAGSDMARQSLKTRGLQGRHPSPAKIAGMAEEAAIEGRAQRFYFPPKCP